jgi:hypothetical protein
MLAAVGAVLFAISAGFLALLLWHQTLVWHFGGTYVVFAPWLPVAFIACSLVVVVGSALVRNTAKPSRSSALAAMLLTAAAWVTGGIAWAVMGT